MYGYHYFEEMSKVDAFVNTAMILSGMGPMSTYILPKAKSLPEFMPFSVNYLSSCDCHHHGSSRASIPA
jgi:hypothetical protein